MPEAPHLIELCEFFGDFLEFIDDLLLLFLFLEDDELIKFAKLFGDPALDLGSSTLDIGDELDIFFKEFFFISEYVLDLELVPG